MKKFFKLFVPLTMGLFLCSSLLTSCGNDDDDNNGSTEYFYHSGHSYKVIKKNKTWVEAAADAVAMGGYLAEIGSKAEQEAIYKGILDAKISPTYTKVADGGGVGYIWIGANDMANEGKWIWNGANKSGSSTSFWSGSNTGSAVAGAYNNWGGTSANKLNEPDNFTDSSVSPNGQNAAAIGLANWPDGDSSPLGKAGEWNDIADTNKIYYVVEFDEEL